MGAQFWPCPACSRHVKRGDALCPFCGARASVDIGATRVLSGRLSRAALFAAGTMGAAVATTGCSSPAYGGPIVYGHTKTEDASASDGASVEAADAADASATTVPTDSSSAADAPMAPGILYGAVFLPDE